MSLRAFSRLLNRQHFRLYTQRKIDPSLALSFTSASLRYSTGTILAQSHNGANLNHHEPEALALLQQEINRLKITTATTVETTKQALALMHAASTSLQYSRSVVRLVELVELCSDVLFLSDLLVKVGLPKEAALALNWVFVLLSQRSHMEPNKPQILLTLANVLELASLMGAQMDFAEEALRTSEQLINVLHQLMVLHPNSHSLLSRLGAAELNYACRHIDLQLLEEALLPMSRSLLISRQLTLHQDPVTRYKTLGVTLHEMSYLCGAMGRMEEALEFSEESLRLARAAYIASGYSLAPIVMDSLRDFHDRALALEHGEKGISHIVPELRQVIQDGWNCQTENHSIRGQISEKACDHARDLLRNGRHGEASDLVEDLLLLKDVDGVLGQQGLGHAHFTLGACLWDRGDRHQAIEMMQTSVNHYRNAGSDASFQLACAMNELGRMLYLMGHIEGSLKVTAEAVYLQKQSLKQYQQDHDELLNLVAYMVELSNRHLALLQFEPALRVATDAQKICRHNLEHPLAHSKLTDALLSSIKAYFGLADYENVVKLVTEAMVILQFQIEEERDLEESIEKAVECSRLIIPSWEALGNKSQDLTESKVFLQQLVTLQQGVAERRT